MNELRKPTKEEKEEFDKIDKKLDNVKKESAETYKQKARTSNINMQQKIFMKISDVDIEDAKKFKSWCDRYVDGKQFLGIKVMMLLMERIEPLLINFSKQLNDLDERLNILENNPKEDEDKLQIPKTQGKGEKK